MPACAEKVTDLGNDNDKEKDAAQPAPDPIYSMGIPSDWGDAGTSSGAAPVRLVDKERVVCVGGTRDTGSGSDRSYSSETSFIVDSGRLYWVSLSDANSGKNDYLRSCDVSNCAQTLTSSAPYPSEVVCGSFPQQVWMHPVQPCHCSHFRSPPWAPQLSTVTSFTESTPKIPC